MQDTVIVHFDQDGEQTYLVHGEKVRLFIVDERAPDDRTYLWLPRYSEGEIANVLKDDVAGSSKDERHNAIAHAVNAYCEGTYIPV